MRSLLAAITTRMRASVWARPALKLLLVLAGLVVLAGIGRTVTATAAVGGQAPPAVSSASASASPVTSPPTDAGFDADARASPAPAPAPTVHSARATTDDPVYLNEATTDDLRRLPGIGEKRAQAILELRTKLGRFRQIEELLRIKGIGRATLKKLRPLVRLERPDGG